jgi:hypothetical protein
MTTSHPSEQDQQFPPKSTFSIENLRAFEAKSTIELSRINLVFGANSSGKSTLGKAMLALAQLQQYETVHRLTTAPNQFLSRIFPGRSSRPNFIEDCFGSRMETLSFANNHDPITISISTEDYEHDSPGGDTKVEFTLSPSRKHPLHAVELSSEGIPIARWSEKKSELPDIGALYVKEANNARKSALRGAIDLQGTIGFPNETDLSGSSGLIRAADIAREVISYGLGSPPKYGFDRDAAGELKRLNTNPASVNQLIKSLGANVRVANPRTSGTFQLFDEASGLSLGLEQVGSGIGQLIAVAARLDRAKTASRSLKGLRSSRFPFLLIQEPEAHLHPVKQAEIGEMLCREALRNPMRLVIETHSDALLFRCLRLIRKGELSHNLLRVVFVEQDTSGRSTARNLQVGSDGSLLDPFPIGFLDWGLEDLIGQ